METARIMVWGYNAPLDPLSDGTTMNVSRIASNLLNELSVNELDVGKVSNFFCFPSTGPNDSLFERQIRLSLCAIAWED